MLLPITLVVVWWGAKAVRADQGWRKDAEQEVRLGVGAGTYWRLSSRGRSWMGLGPGPRRPVCAGKPGVTDHVSGDPETD